MTAAALRTTVPALYDAQVRHVRRAAGPAQGRSFEHGVYLWLVDLDALPTPARPLRFLARFQARDHLGDPTATIRENVDTYLAAHGIDLAGGRVLMLANARSAGHVFNPITVYWCHAADGSLTCVIAEVHNTYGERHCYLLHPDDSGAEAGRYEVDKQFYVSPFLTVDGRYRMSLPAPGERLAIAVTLHQHGSAALAATVTGVRRPATPGGLLAMAARRPFVTHRTSALIRRHGIALWMRRIRIHPRPQHIPE